jgi:hypothetical protein
LTLSVSNVEWAFGKHAQTLFVHSSLSLGFKKSNVFVGYNLNLWTHFYFNFGQKTLQGPSFKVLSATALPLILVCHKGDSYWCDVTLKYYVIVTM